MKSLIILAVVGLTYCAKLDKTYLPPHAQTSGGSGNFLQTPNFRGSSPHSGFNSNGIDVTQNGNGFAQNDNGFDHSNNGFSQNGNFNSGFADNDRPERPRAALERNAAILRQDTQNDGETFSYSFETENGIYAEESGVATNGIEAQGGYSYTGDDGQVYSIRYTADQNGFVPQGDHLPTAPPVPEEILKALEQNARDEAAGIFDDGSYHDGKYADSDEGSNSINNYPNSNQNFGNHNGNENYPGNNGFNSGRNDAVITNSAAYENQRPERRGPFGQTPAYRQEPTNGVTNAYLPPRDQIREPSRFNTPNSRSSSFGQRSATPRRPNFNARDGYQY